MRIYISVDMEGISNVVSNDQCFPKGHLYAAACKQTTYDVNAAIEGALAAGATEFVVNDAHGNQMNLVPELLHEDAELIWGSKKPLGMMAGIDGGFAGAMLIGYHSRNNTAGVMCHTLSGGIVNNLWINDKLVGETAYNALKAGMFNVPVIMVTGDDILCAEAKKDLGEHLTAIQVKKAISVFSAQCPHPKKTTAWIKEGAKKAISQIKNCLPLVIHTPCVAKMQFKSAAQAQSALSYPGTVRESSDTLSYQAESVEELIQAVSGMMTNSR